MDEPLYLRFPHLHGDLVAFVAEDDVWLAPLDGEARAWRVSADRAPVADPRFSPDGEWVAWTSGRDGAPEAHVAPVAGGPARRLTYWGSERTRVRGWTPDGAVIAVTSAGQASLRRTWAHAVPLDGGPSRRLPYGPVADVAYGPGGGVVLGSVTIREHAAWKRYRGGTAGKLWLDREGSGTFARMLGDLDGNVVAPMWVGRRIAFVSDHEGVGNLYSCRPDGGGLRRHTDHADFYARNPSTDGTRVVYHCAGDLWLVEDLDDVEGAPRRIPVHLGGPRTGRQPHPIPARGWIGEFAPDDTGRASAVEVRGAVFWLTHQHGPARALHAEAGVRARLPRVLGDSGNAVWVSDAEGDDAVEVAPADGSGPVRRLAPGRLGRVLELATAPDGTHIAAASHDGRVMLVDPQTGEVREVDRSVHGDCNGLAFSPDSAWLVWSHPGPEPLRQIRLARLEDLDTVDVTPLRFVDSDPVFTLDGRHVALLSVRSFDPVYDAHSFDLSFPAGARPYLVPLAATTPSPFAPEREGRATARPRPDEEDARPPRATIVEPDGLAERIVPFPVPEARYSNLIAAKDSLLWITEPVAGVLGESRAADAPPSGVLQRFDLLTRRCHDLVDHVLAAQVSGDGTRLVVRDRDGLRILRADRSDPAGPGPRGTDAQDPDDVRVDLARLRVVVDPTAEWRQMYDEAGRLMRDHFWVGDMAGVDWDGVLRRYRPLVDRVGSHDDLVDLLWEVNGELGASHAYVLPRGRWADPARRQGLLGADLERDGDGAWRITRVLAGESSDAKARSPLAAPGVAVRPGDALLAVDGLPVDPGTGPWPLLAGTADHPVELTVQRDGEAPRRVVVVPIADEERLRYHDWVADRRRAVHEATGGRVGYLHVPDMMGVGWAQLHRDLRLEMAREGLVVDVRENRGGHVSQLVVEKLARRVIGWDVARERQPSTYPLDAPRGPVVVVADEYAGSDGDIVTAAVKAMGIGPVVGTRTWGGVIGIDMRYGLVDGTGVTQPRYAFWFGDGIGWGVENYGVDPDIEVVMTPQDWAAGRDPQLDHAVQLAIERLAQRPAATPPDPATRPSRAPPPLPPRG